MLLPEGLIEVHEYSRRKLTNSREEEEEEDVTRYITKALYIGGEFARENP